MKRKKLFVVLDNINNAGLSKEIERVIDVFLAHSTRYRIIVGSIEKQPFLNIMNEMQLGYIELPAFSEDDIFDFAERNSKSISSEYLKRILDFSDGLPIFVNLLLTNDIPILSPITYNNSRVDTYLKRIISELEKPLCVLAQYIGFLSIVNPIIPINLLSEFSLDLSAEYFENLENCSLIEYDRKNHTVKMHELFRNHICRFFSSSTKIIQEIYDYYRQTGLLYEQIYYMIMLKSEVDNDDIVFGVQNAIKEENFAFLLAIGEHFKCLYDWNVPTANITKKTFLAIVYGYVEGLVGVGNYPAAREVIDRCKIAARSPETDLQFRYSILTAKLYHLQNNYSESISLYSILLSEAQRNKRFKKYIAKCLFGIAHSYRHQGRDLDKAIQYYNESIRIAKNCGRKSDFIMGMREKLTILLCRNQMKAAKKLYRKILIAMDSLPKTGYKGTKTAFLKTKAQYLAISKRKSSDKEYALLSKALASYKLQKKRLQYNIFFQIGEYYRHLKDYNMAKENFRKALSFSKKNNDYNLETLSQVALIICDICSNTMVPEIAEESIVNCIDACEQHDLYMNKLLSEMVLAYVQGIPVDGSVIANLSRLHYASAVQSSCKASCSGLHELRLFLM